MDILSDLEKSSSHGEKLFTFSWFLAQPIAPAYCEAPDPTFNQCLWVPSVLSVGACDRHMCNTARLVSPGMGTRLAPGKKHSCTARSSVYTVVIDSRFPAPTRVQGLLCCGCVGSPGKEMISWILVTSVLKTGLRGQRALLEEEQNQCVRSCIPSMSLTI